MVFFGGAVRREFVYNSCMDSRATFESMTQRELIDHVVSFAPILAKRDERIAALERENAWFRKQLFGRKSERRLLQAEPSKQIPLGEDFTAELPPPAEETVRAYQRKRTTLPEVSEDETPIKAGRKSPGKLNQGYYWALYGDKDEVSFPYSDTRAFGVVREILGSFCGVLLADGYGAYDRYAQEEKDVVLAQCWAHTRRNFVEAEGAERDGCGQALDFIGELYRHEDSIRRKGLSGEAKLVYRAEYSKPVVEAFFVWLAKKFAEWSILASSPFAKAASYALERQSGLSVFLSNPNVAIDTNHLERGLRGIPMGKEKPALLLDRIFFKPRSGQRSLVKFSRCS
jgi:hypothetical protein